MEKTFMSQIKTLKIAGMTCMHCTGKVSQALKAVPGVSQVKVNLMTEEAEVLLNRAITDAEFKKVVGDAGYQFLSSK
jgi:Cu+-exporting ATPase